MDSTQHSFGEVVRVALLINRFEINEEVAIVVRGFDEQRHDGIACDFGILFKWRRCVRELPLMGAYFTGRWSSSVCQRLLSPVEALKSVW